MLEFNWLQVSRRTAPHIVGHCCAHLEKERADVQPHEADALSRLGQRAKGGPYSRNLFCTGCAQVGDVQCEPLQLVALKTKVC